MERCFGGGSTISTSLIAVVPGAGHEINKIYPPGVASTPTSGFVPAVICNEFVFVAGQMAHNPGTGLDPRVIVPDHAAWAGIPIRQQTEFLIVEKLKPALEAAGSSLEQSVKAQIYLADIADMPDCLNVWSRYYASIPCAITVVPTKSFATVGGIIEINLIALTNGAIRQKEVVDANIPGMAAFGPSLKVGEFLLPSGLMAIGRDGHIAGSIVSPNFPGLAHAGYSQAEAVYGYAEALCQAAGTTMDRLLRAQYFMADIGAFPGIAMAWSSRYSDQPHPFVCVQTPQPMPAPGAALIADFWISTIS
jgi:enamine deaminase RidA (YjgF/YER057c/UK114 family)